MKNFISKLVLSSPYMQLINTANEGIWILDTNDRIEYVNSQLTNLLGFSEAEMVGHVISEFLAEPGDRKHIETGIHDIKLRRKDQETMWTRVSGNQLLDEQAKVIGLIGMFTDIDKKKNLEDAFLQTEKDLLQLTNAMPQIVWTANPKGEIFYYNDRWFEYTGMSKAGLLGWDWTPLIHPDDLEFSVARWTESFQTGKAYELEFRLKRASDQMFRWHLARANPVQDENGNISKWFGTTTDIEDQKQAQVALKETQSNLDAIIQHTPIILWAVDLTGKFTLADGLGLKSLGLKSKELVGKSVYIDFIDDIDFTKNIERALSGESFQVEAALGPCWFASHYSPAFDQDQNIIGVVGSSIDITEQKKSELERAGALLRERAALEASEMKSKFLANMSHEIRTPLNGVIGMTSFLLKTELNAEQLEYCEIIKSSGDMLLTLVNDILDLSKAESGMLSLECIDFSLEHVVSEVVKSQIAFAADKKLKIVAPNLQHAPVYLKGDPSRLKQILVNLLNNAVKFTAQGEIKINLVSEEDTIKFEVVDSGIGIPQNKIERIFEAFTQADSSTTRKFGGTGLGLSISQHLVSLMGGKIGVKSREGQGACFWFEIPLDIGGEPSYLGSGLAETRNRGSLKILIAEDNITNQKIATQMLEDLGHTVKVVSNGIEVLKILEEQTFDIIFMDCHMPEMDGYQATRRIREKALPSLREMPIVAMTANAMSDDREKCLAAGMNDYIAKPIRQILMSNTIDRLIIGKS